MSDAPASTPASTPTVTNPTIPITFAPQRTSSLRPQRIQPSNFPSSGPTSTISPSNASSSSSSSFSSGRRANFDRYSKISEEASNRSSGPSGQSSNSGSSSSGFPSNSASSGQQQGRRRDDNRMQNRGNQGGGRDRDHRDRDGNWNRIERVGRFESEGRTGKSDNVTAIFPTKDAAIPSLAPRSLTNAPAGSGASPSTGLTGPVLPLIPATSFPDPTADPQYSPAGVPVHPLQNRWVLWFDHRIQKKPTGQMEVDDYESNLNEVGAFTSVEGFWQLFHHVLLPSQLEMGANYHLFKNGIKPTWEDPSNAAGGKWAVRFSNREKGHIDYYWLNIAMAVIGETIDEGDEICGAVFSKRKGGDRIAIWIRTKDKEAELMRIGQRIKTALMDGIPGIPLSLAFDAHEVALNTGYSYYSTSHKYEIK